MNCLPLPLYSRYIREDSRIGEAAIEIKWKNVGLTALIFSVGGVAIAMLGASLCGAAGIIGLKFTAFHFFHPLGEFLTLKGSLILIPIAGSAFVVEGITFVILYTFAKKQLIGDYPKGVPFIYYSDDDF